MTTTTLRREALAEGCPDMLFADGLDAALVGTMMRFPTEGQPEPVALYDYDTCIEIFMAEGCSYEEAVEHFEFNVIGGWHGPHTPAFANLRVFPKS